MPFRIRDRETDALVRHLAPERGCGLTEAVKQAVDSKLRRERNRTPSQVRLRALQDEVAAIPDTGLDADKAFYDALSGDED
jgi:antitoxin VapB